MHSVYMCTYMWTCMNDGSNNACIMPALDGDDSKRHTEWDMWPC